MGRPAQALRLLSSSILRGRRGLGGIVLLLGAGFAGLAMATGVQAQPVRSFCPLEQAAHVPTTFDGCAELERKVVATQQFMGPDGFRLREYEDVVAKFFEKYCHRNAAAGWVRDKRVRDTGPFAAVLEPTGTWSAPKYFGTHLPVVIWYNPKMIDWLRRNRPESGAAPATQTTLPDGAMMVKEMFPAPAARCAAVPPERLSRSPDGVAFMVRDAAASQDGWFWGAWWPGFRPDWPAAAGNGLPAMGFAAYCLNCHASAVDHSTFAGLKNIQGEPGEPNVYLSQNFLFENSIAPAAELGQHRQVFDTSDDPPREREPLPDYAPAFLLRFPQADPPTAGDIVALPSQTYDHTWVPAGALGAKSEFLTSSQCIGCHDAGSTGLQYDMTEPSPRVGRLLNFSPYGTWRTSPMGLGGRDPVFLAQLASEIETFHPQRAGLVQDVCFGCHGIQGQRQLAIDRFEAGGDCGQFDRAMVHSIPFPADEAENPGVEFASYGALARDGIACTACHRMALSAKDIAAVAKAPQNHCVEQRQKLLNPQSSGFARTFTGSFYVGPPDVLVGPFTDPKPKPMDHALGIRPEHSATIKSSEVCGSCHTVHLPIYGDAGRLLGYTYEQTTYPEWAMSAYRTGETSDGQRLPAGAGGRAQSCQGCHMRSTSATTGAFRSKIASIQEFSNFPATEHTLPGEDIDLAVREGFARHTLVGLNVFFVAMAQQFPNVLGIPTQDPMMVSRGLDPLLLTERAMLDQAATDTASVEIFDLQRDARQLSARVQVTNRVGHKFPSGVGFRRAFLTFEVLDAGGRVLWASGRTDATGTIVDAEGKPIAGEQLWQTDCSARLPGQPHQPHYQVVRRQDQAQIYQELTTAPVPGPDPHCGPTPLPGGAITTSFLSICGQLKDNRLLPHGFLDHATRVAIAKAFGAGPELAEETGPHGVGDDPDYVHGGGDSLRYEVDISSLHGQPAYVRASLFYQATPPYFLEDRFCTSKSQDTERLYFLAGHLDLEKGPASSWKLAVTGTGLVAIE